jgi:hypothetical protein
MTKLTLFALATGALTACSGVTLSYTALRSPPKPPHSVAADKVEVITTGDPTRKYVEIGSFLAHRDDATREDDMMKKLRLDAGEHGCEALIVTAKDPSEVVASCIIYTE